VVAIVGYTNAGKSTLLNTLTDAGVLAEDRLFATLDTRARKLHLPGGRDVVLTDTVGFIRQMPKDLFAAFRATFEEAADADLIVEVVDVSDAEHQEHLKTTSEVLRDLELDETPRLRVYNKVDRLSEDERHALDNEPDSVSISALDKSSTKTLLSRIESWLLLIDHQRRTREAAAEAERLLYDARD
jgi:GTP-binding protein HflX